MSYSLELYFEPAVRRDRVLAHFGARRRFSMKDDDVVYENRDTGVYFFMRLRSARKLFRSSIVSAEFEINYCRPSYFGIEAEKVLSDFVAVFRPRIEDPQIQGMGEGPVFPRGISKRLEFRQCVCRPQKLDYRVTPPPIADWVANIPLIDLDALEKLSADKILDDELIAAAREFETKVIPDHSDGQELE